MTVATSDGLEQIIITGQGCRLLSAREFEREVEAVNHNIREIMDEAMERSCNRPLADALQKLVPEGKEKPS